MQYFPQGINPLGGKILLLFFTLIFFTGCSDSAMVSIIDEKITQGRVSCLRLVVFPPDKMIESTLKELYDFNKRCDLKLEVSKKDGISCNSNQNTQKKALSNFPSSYLKMQIRQKKSLKYSYYIDLEDAVRSSDVQQGFERIKKDLQL